MIKIPKSIRKDEDKIKYLYRSLELLRLEHNVKGKDFRDKKISQMEWVSYVKKIFEPKSKKLFLVLNPLKENMGFYKVNVEGKSNVLGLNLKANGKKETKWDKDISLEKL